MHNPEMIIAPIFFLSCFGTIFGIVYMRNKENMALIDKGINPRTSRPALPRSFFSLKMGLLLTGAGLGLALAFWADQALIHHKVHVFDDHTYEEDYPQIYFAMIGMFGGLGLVLSYLIEKKHWDTHGREESATLPTPDAKKTWTIDVPQE